MNAAVGWKWLKYQPTLGAGMKPFTVKNRTARECALSYCTALEGLACQSQPVQARQIKICQTADSRVATGRLDRVAPFDA